MLNEKDSVRYYAKKGLESDNHRVQSLCYAFLGDMPKAMAANTLVYGNRLDTPDDLMTTCYKLVDESMLLGIAGHYPEAVKKIQELNNQYPSFNQYRGPLQGIYFEKIRREYPPFLKAVNERKQQPIPDPQQFIKF